MATPQKLYPSHEPDYAVPPGETIREFLDELGMIQRQLAAHLALSPKHVDQLIQGLVPLSPEVAARLEPITGMPARLWNRLEVDYQAAQVRLATT
jgi:HTH-type transcriptional regulator/antitoxin HigA